MKWLCLGGSPLARVAYQKGLLQRPDRIISTNAGILIDPRPDFYLLFDWKATELYDEPARRAWRGGTIILTQATKPLGFYPVQHAFKPTAIDWADEYVDMAGYEPIQASGLLCVEYACRNGASEVLLCGMDGYEDDRTDRWIVPRVNTLLRKYPAVQFTCIGRPVYADRIDGDNWRTQWLATLEAPAEAP